MRNVSVNVNGINFELGSEFDARQSSVQQYINCHRLYGWERVEGLTPERPRWALEFGSGVHLHLLKRKQGFSAEEATKAGIDRMMQAFPPSRFDEEVEEREGFKELYRRMMPAYESYWSGQSEELIPFGLEVAGRVEVGTGTNCFIVFRLDELATQIGALWLVDHKTMGKNDDRDFQKYENSLQMIAYVYAASKLLGQRVVGVIIDGLIKTKTPQFRRESFMYSDEQLEEFEQYFPEICKEIAWRHQRVQNGEDWKIVFWPNTKQCRQYGNCSFLELCMSDSLGMRGLYKQRDPDYMDDPKLLKPKEE